MSLLVYKSSAGSGKTFTLVKEYLKLALGSEDPMVFSKILAITFTNKAANEMTDRILETLEELGGVKGPMKSRTKFLGNDLINELGISEEILKSRSRKTLKKIVHNYRDFSVGTIDSFVHRVIRSFATEMGLNQQFEVELNSENILKRAVDLLLDKVGVDEKLTFFIEQYIDGKFEDGGTWKIDEDLFNFSKGLLNTHEWFYLNKARTVSLDNYTLVYTETRKRAKEYESFLLQLGNEILNQAISGIDIKAYAHSGGMFSNVKKVLKREFVFDSGKRFLQLLEPDSKWHSGKATKEEKALIDERKESLLLLLNKFEDYRIANEQEYIFNDLVSSNIYGVALLSEIDKYVQKIKKEKDLVLISDFTDLVGSITRNEYIPFIFEKLGEHYQHYLFDEFQDTSLMQWHNMLPLVEESLSKGGTTMVVGDSKQSIYRWRGGVVEQFENLPEVFNPYNDEFVDERKTLLLKSNKQVDPLRNNWRSQQNIIEFNNLFFEKSSVALGGDLETYYQDVKQESPSKTGLGFVHFQFFYGRNKEEYLEDSFEYIACMVKRLKSENFRLKDIAILTKTKSDTPALVEYLDSQNIDVISSESLLVSNSKGVSLVTSVLQFINNPGVSFFQSDLLIAINKVKSQHNFHQIIKNADSLTEERVLNILTNWGYDINRNELLAYPLYELISYVIEIFGLDKSQDNRLATFMDYVFNYTQKPGIGLFDLLDDWNTQKSKLSIQIPEDVNAVNVLTIHKSKGLDWPVVILAQGNWKKKSIKHKIWVDVSNQEPLPTLLLPTNAILERTVFKEAYVEELSRIQVDNFNALYVAMTRPSERLYVVGANPESDFFGEVFPTLLEMEGNPKVKVSRVEADKKTVVESFSYGVEKVLEDDANSVGEDSNIIRLKNEKNSLYRKKLKVKKNYLKRMDDQSGAEYGNVIHKAFSYIKSMDDVSFALNRMEASGEIEAADKFEIKEVIQKVISHPQLEPLFQNYTRVKNEHDLVLPNGELLRPDRVVFDSKEVTVIDFKTGMRKPQHDAQILGYKNQLLKMGYPSVKALLVYTSDVEVVEV